MTGLGLCQVSLQERQRAGTSKCCGFGVVAGAHVAIEPVARVFVPMDLDFRMGDVDPVDLFVGDMRVELAEMQLDGGVRGFSGVIADAAGVVADREVGLETSCAEPGEETAKAVTDDAGFSAGLLSHVSESGVNILETFRQIEPLVDRHALLGFGAVVGKFDITLDAVEQRGSNGEEAIVGVAVGNRSDVLIDAEDLLDDNEASYRFARGAGQIGVELVAVRRGKPYVFAHEDLTLWRRGWTRPSGRCDDLATAICE